MKDCLHAYQQPHADRLAEALSTHGVALDASDLGTGKTFVAAATAKRLGLRLAVVAPKPVLTSWKRVAERFGVEVCGIYNYEAVRGERQVSAILRVSNSNGASLKTPSLSSTKFSAAKLGTHSMRGS